MRRSGIEDARRLRRHAWRNSSAHSHISSRADSRSTGSANGQNFVSKLVTRSHSWNLWVDWLSSWQRPGSRRPINPSTQPTVASRLWSRLERTGRRDLGFKLEVGAVVGVGDEDAGDGAWEGSGGYVDLGGETDGADEKFAGSWDISVVVLVVGREDGEDKER